jgi:hypothetical protein
VGDFISSLNKAVFGLATVVMVGILAASPGVGARQEPPDPNNVPSTKDQCKDGGYAQYSFKNQGQCVSFVEHNDTGYTSSRPGNGFGDDNHEHTGPPGQQ